MIVDMHVHVWEIDPPKYPADPTVPSWNSYLDEPATADELLVEWTGQCWCRRAGLLGITATSQIR